MSLDSGDREAALPLAEEEEDDEFVDAAALAKSSSFRSSSSALTTAAPTTSTTTQQQQQRNTTNTRRRNHLRPLIRGIKLGLASSYYSVAEVLRLRRLGEIVKVKSFFLSFFLF